MEICLSLNGVFISFPLLENGIGPIIISDCLTASVSFSQKIISLHFFSSSDCSIPNVKTLFPSFASILANLIILKSPPIIVKFVLIKSTLSITFKSFIA